ncbi:MAG TPA: serine hydrolase domain-containing protein, partial [Acidimicrobiales bacterium]|nr:serine hydrolase domain-containing protein [Acidimicrobiales bacterium]
MPVELADIVASVAAEHSVPGVATGVLTYGGDTIVASHGITNVEHPLAVDEHTLFQVASITKTFTSAAVMLLVESGDVSLDDPVTRHLPGLEHETWLDVDAITIEHLLSHQAGFDGDHLFVNRVTDSLRPLREARRLFPPGEGFSYNNAAFSIAGELIAA